MMMMILPYRMQCAIPKQNKKPFIPFGGFGERGEVRQAYGVDHKGQPNVPNKTILFKAINIVVNLNVNGRL